MGSADDSNAVVDERLRVRNVNSLRVIDASVMPQVSSGNTNAPTIMIAEKGADMVREDYENAPNSVCDIIFNASLFYFVLLFYLIPL